jgi:hypothetical protein
MQWELSLHGIWKIKLPEKTDDLENSKTNIKADITSDIWKSGDFTETITLPGILQAAGFGNDISEHTPWVSGLHDKLWYERDEYKVEGMTLQVPFLSQPPKHYLGLAWYQKKFVIPEECRETKFYLQMECVKWKTACWVDDIYIGSYEGLCTPHEYYLDELSKGEHTLTIAVDNGLLYPYRPDGHMVSDALGATWNGIVGDIRIIGRAVIHMEQVKVYPNIDTKEVQVCVPIINHEKDNKKVLLLINKVEKEVILDKGLNTLTFVTKYPKDSLLWDEFNQGLHQVTISLIYDGKKEDEIVSFGFRNIEVKDGLFYVNHRPTFFRGTHFGGDFPLTGYPSTKVEDWKRIFLICKDWGLNYIRFHSFCPPKAAFLAADAIGIYLQIECGMWNIFNEGNHMDEVLWEETVKILNSFGNHPSFVMLSPSNEPGGDWFDPLTKWVSKCKEEDSRRIYTTQSGWPFPMEPSKIYGTDYVYFHRSGYGIQPGGTIRNSKGWHGKDYLESVSGINFPVISHELGQWCSYPDFDVIHKFTGYLKPSNYIAFRENAKGRGVYEQHKEFANLSGKLKVIFYKEEIEATFRTPHIYGFELLDLHDYIGQGSALVGLLDPFWEEKGFITKEEFKAFCSETVPLLRLEKRIFTTKEKIQCPLEFSHFGKDELTEKTIYCNLVSTDGEVIRKQFFSHVNLPFGKNIVIGEVIFELEDLEPAKEYVIIIGIEGTNIKNSYNLWIFDGVEGVNKTIHNEILFTNSLCTAIDNLKLGKKVIYQPRKEHHRLDSPPLNFKTSFWNSQMGPTYSRGMGLVIDKNHKAFSLFPTEEYADWQWEEIMTGAYGLNLDKLPKELEPIVQPIDDWNRNYRLGMILECKVYDGSLLIVTADLVSNLSKRLAARQLKESLIQYVTSTEFNPNIEVTETMLYESFFPRGIMRAYGVKVAEEFKDMIDGEPNTFYQKENGYPLTIDMETPKEVAIKGLIYMPRQNERQHKGDIKGIRVEAFINGDYENLYDGELSSSFDPKEILFPKEISTTKVRITPLYGFSGKGISNFREDKDGWHHEIIDYEDTSIAIGDLLFIPVHKDFDIDVMVEENEITLRSATKEIDY